MSLFLGNVEKRQWTAEPVIPPVRGASIYGGGATVTNQPDQALTIPTVWSCVSLISNAVAMLPIETFEESSGGVPSRIPNPQVLRNPYGDMTQAEWIHMAMVSMLLRGNIIARSLERDNQRLALPTQVQILNPDLVKLDADEDTGALRYTLTSNGKLTEIPRDDVWHVRGLTMPGSRVGLSPISYAAAMMNVDLAARQFASDFFFGGGIPKAVVSTDQPVNQEQSRTIKDRVLAATRNREPIVLGQGLSYKTISVNPEESQFLATHAQTVTEVARLFNVPAGMVGGSEGGSMTYANVEQRSLDFLVHCVQPWLQRLEQALAWLLPPSQFVKFDTRVLLRTDAETQAKVWNQLLAGKIVVPSEIRQEMGRPPMTDAQKIEADMVPLAITPLGGAKALPAMKAPPGATAPVPASDQQGAADNAA